MEITRTNPFSQQINTREIAVTEEQLCDWESGMLIQNAMPNLSAEDREFIMTGMLPEDWPADSEEEED